LNLLNFMRRLYCFSW